MRTKLILPLLALAIMAPAAVQAQVYTWKDAQGTVHYSDAPPPHGVKYTRINVKSDAANGPATARNGATPAPAASASSDTGTAETADASRRRMCANLKSNIELLNSSQAVNMAGANGKLHALTKDQRARQLKLSQEQFKRYCH